MTAEKETPNNPVGGLGPFRESYRACNSVQVFPHINNNGLNTNKYMDYNHYYTPAVIKPIERSKLSVLGAGHTYFYYRLVTGAVIVVSPIRYYDAETHSVCCQLKSFKAVDSDRVKDPSPFHKRIQTEHTKCVDTFKISYNDLLLLISRATPLGWSITDRTSDKLSSKSYNIDRELYNKVEETWKDLLELHKGHRSSSNEALLGICEKLQEQLDDELKKLTTDSSDIAAQLMYAAPREVQDEINHTLAKLVGWTSRVQRLRDTISGFIGGLYSGGGADLGRDLEMLKAVHPLLNYIKVENDDLVVVLSGVKLVLGGKTGVAKFVGDTSRLKDYF